MTLQERQDRFIEQLEEFDAWHDKFNYLIELSDMLPVECPKDLLKHRIGACQSRTCFRAWNEDGFLRVNGWSNVAVQRGIIRSMIDIFDETPLSELSAPTGIYFHEKSGLIHNLTAMRAAGLQEMIKKIIVL